MMTSHTTLPKQQTLITTVACSVPQWAEELAERIENAKNYLCVIESSREFETKPWKTKAITLISHELMIKVPQVTFIIFMILN
jgi:hypothetical protein